MPSATSPSTNPTTAPTSRPPLPPPQTFDFLPPVYALLSRLTLPTNNGDISSPAPSPQNNNINNNTSPLSPKDLATAASPIIAKIQKARNAVKALPGIEMGNEELEEMIKELEAEVERLNGVERNIKKAVREGLSTMEKKEKKDGEGEGQEEEAMEEG
ncbi:hypothetical protein JMJ35_000479 [Cladonia borealis]|uniref:Mediator of RNA polymerase II transcription subunit 9 n=1 Tax=Cladonia borealis TaxID=184061 RepID=A0AA39RB45_9LECA|nr:hypothetical protein JMJ35_000479 [Cladonia borealis]